MCCSVISIAFFSIGLSNLIAKTDNSNKLSCIIRGFIWISLTVSLLVQRIKWIRILNSIWWLSSCVLVSALNIHILFKDYDAIETFDIIIWLVHFLLLLCALKNFGYLGNHSVQECLSEPLLAQKIETKEIGLDHATFLSKLIFSWVNSLLILGYSKPLDLEDIPSLVSEDEANTTYKKFVYAWETLVRERTKNNTKSLVLWSIVRTYLKENILIAFYALLRTISVAVSPLILYAFVNYSHRTKIDLKEGLSIVGILILSKLFESFSQRHWFFNSRRSGMKMRSALMAAVYRKQLKLSSSARTRHSAGEIVNYIAVDAYRMGEFPWWFHITWTSALQLVLSTVILFGVVGIGALPGLVPLLICGLLNVPFARILQNCQSHFMIAQDTRLRSTSEILNSMKIIKLQSWEEKFKSLVESLRNREFVWLSKAQILKAFGSFLYWMSPTVISSVVFVGCIVSKSATLNAETIFTILVTLRNMAEPVRMIPEALSIMIQVKVSFDRLSNFLLDEELNNDDSDRSLRQCPVDAVEIQDGNFIWDHESVSPTLTHVNLEIKQGQKVAVCGPVGAGKSSLLYAILGEILKISGTVNVGGTLAYVSQSSWIQSGTVQDNILFGKPMDKTRYEKAIKACALDKDINDFSHGDLTEIGQRGINMSGGQKQRIQLARAVYNDADIYLLDDPFSAVDAHTASILFNDCVMTSLREKTVVLVTHQVEFLSEVDTILVMEGGKVIESGNYENLLTAGTAFELLMSAHKDTITDLNQDSENKIGSENETSSTYWLAIAIEIPKVTNVTLIGVYALISFSSAAFIYVRTYLTALLGLKASTVFFSSFTTAIFNAPMLFFDSTPVGRILTRASSDLYILDFDIPYSITFVASITLEIVVVTCIMVSVTWQVLIVAAPAMVASILIQNYYQATARELIRINGTTKAPVMNFAAETSHGVVTVRAFNMLDRFFENYLKLVDMDASLFFHSNVAMEWVILRVEALQNLTVITAALLLILLPQGYVSPGLVGLSLSYAFTLTGAQVFWTRWFSNLSNYIISVERINQFIHIPAEPPAIVDNNRPPSSWPSKGRIDLQGLEIRYRPNAPLVLKGITCAFKEGSRVGVVGRTGSGKSTLISALFRLVEPSRGDILIDGINICSIGLKDLRMRLSIIPQEPTLFKGSIRTNLDPLGLYSDDEIWKAVEKCQLKETINKLPSLLDSSVSDEGGNLSLGERQLICLGRVLLKRNRILVLDEATASIDSATDIILQRVIRQEFAECTVITVAHRIPTVIDSDMVMVLSYGKLVEFDEPSKLMNTNSSFSKLVAEYWPSETVRFNVLKVIAAGSSNGARNAFTGIVISIAYFSIGLWNLIAKTDNSEKLICMIKGFIWISLAVSLIVQRVKWIRILNSIWWLSSCVLVSALNIHILFKDYDAIETFDIIIWLVHFLLLLCALKNLRYLGNHSVQECLSEPLLAQKIETKEIGLDHATFLSKLIFSWVNSLLTLGYSKPLDLEDIPSLASDDEANTTYQKFVYAWESLVRENTKDNTKSLVLWSIVRTYLKENILIAFYALIRTISVAVSPLILYAFVNYSNRTEVDLKEGLSIVGILILTKLFESFSQRHWFFNSRRSGMKMRSALMVAVYRKQLKLSSSARTRHSAGEIVNYIAVDAYRMGEFPWWFHTAWTSALQIVLSTVILFGVVGIGALPGLVPLLVFGLLNVPFARILKNCQSHIMIAQDKRLQSTSEILNSMKIIKLQSWEEKFKSLVESLHNEEFVWLSKAQILKAFGSFLYWMSPTVISAVVFVGCVVSQSAPLNAETIFTILATLRNMGEPVRMIPEALSIMIQVKVSFDRLNKFLLDEELNNDDSERYLQQCSVNAVEIQDGNFIWDHESVSPTLTYVNVEIKQGQKIAVCGPVGAGKSSLLYAILGEILKTSGTVNVDGTLAYTVVEYGRPADAHHSVLFSSRIGYLYMQKEGPGCSRPASCCPIGMRWCGIILGVIPYKCNMDAGFHEEFSITFSGCCVIRKCLSLKVKRFGWLAIGVGSMWQYNKTVVLKLTASTTTLQDCVMTALREKTVILVTHQVEFLSDVDSILVMEGGKVIQSGSYENLLIAGTAFELLVSARKDTITELNQDKENEVLSNPQDSHGFYLTKSQSEGEISSIEGPIGSQLTQEEEKVIGNVGWKSFWNYIDYSKGSFMLFFIVLAQSVFLALQTSSSYWLAIAIEIPKVTNVTLIGVYALISFASAAFIYGRTYLTALLGLKASTAFFSSFTTAIFNAPMLFFDSTPVGRILTRASSDLSILDFNIPYSITFVVSITLEIAVVICIMVSVTWQVLIIAIPAMVASIFIQNYYQATARELVRINGTTKAPNASLFFHSNVVMEWVILRVEAIQNLTVITAALLLILLPQGYVSSGLVGLSLSYAFTLTGAQVFWTRWFSNLSNYIISVERINQFIHIPSEPPAIVDNNRPPSSWPSKGRIDLQGLEIRYRPNAPLVLKGITGTFHEGSRVGVVGRTGSGKSTLISALFRLVEPSRGDILIDGINICSIGLKDLRMKLSIIPQEPTLFKGSIRTNLDPLGLYSDDEIWKVVEKCQLKETIDKLPSLLDSSVSDEGGNWSLGERQLICLGRVLLKRNRILVLDEATASIDSATDVILQRVIRQEFAECTVITVAHRIPTVIDSDMVMVLSYGKLVEFDEPSKLMNTNSSFSKLVAEYWSSCRKNSFTNISK
ncbi:ABC transporter C family member [Trifolium repens]|nr:ABC transporter C family member [Trifolium repens]